MNLQGRHSLGALLQVAGDYILPEPHEVFLECLDYINNVATIHYMRLPT